MQTRISREQASEVLIGLETRAVMVKPVQDVDESPDPADDILGAAVAGSAAFVVTGDKRDLLSLGVVRGIPIISASNALQLLGDGSQ